MLIRTQHFAMAVATILAALFSPGRAKATSYRYERFMPASQSQLPPRSVVYFFNPINRTQKPHSTRVRFVATTEDGKGLRLNVERVSLYDAYAVYRIKAATTRSFTIDAFPVVPPGMEFFHLHQPNTPVASVRYLVAAKSRGTGRTSGRVRVLDNTESRSECSCSHQNTRDLRVNVSAAAFRVEWAFSAEDYAKGRRESRVLPAFGPHSDIVILGHIGCVGPTFDWENRRAAFVGVTALHEDGSETPSGGPVEVARPSRPGCFLK